MDSIEDSRVTVIHQKNRGLGATLNRSLELCNTEYYARMDADDFSFPERLEAQLQYMREHKDVVLLGSQVEFITGDKTIKAPILPSRHEKIVKLLLKGKPVFCHPTMMARAEAIRKTGGYKIEGLGEEFDFFLRISEIGQLMTLHKILLRYRMHLGSLTASRYNEIRLGTAYAIKCYKCRQQRISEPTIYAFQEFWKRRNLLRKLIDKINWWSGIQYRRGLLDLGEEKNVRGTFRIASAAICRPKTATRHMISKLRGK